MTWTSTVKGRALTHAACPVDGAGQMRSAPRPRSILTLWVVEKERKVGGVRRASRIDSTRPLASLASASLRVPGGQKNDKREERRFMTPPEAGRRQVFR